MPADADHVPFAHLVSTSQLTLVLRSDQSCCCDIQGLTGTTRPVSRLILGNSSPIYPIRAMPSTYHSIVYFLLTQNREQLDTFGQRASSLQDDLV